MMSKIIIPQPLQKINHFFKYDKNFIIDVLLPIAKIDTAVYT